jgi:hypothetical protein
MIEESAMLRPLPTYAFEPRLVVLIMVSKQSTVNVAEATYIPSHIGAV